MEKQSKISLNLILAGLLGWLLLVNGCGKPAGSDKVATKGTALGDKAGGEPCEDCVSPGSRSALLLAAAKNQQSKADPANIDDPIVEEEIRKTLKKPTGELTKADLEKVTKVNLFGNQLTEVPKGLEKLTQLTGLYLSDNQLTNVKGFEKLTQLEYLNLINNQLTDVKGLEKLTQLTQLNLGNNQLTDVKGLEKLTHLDLLEIFNNPALTKAQIAELQKALPKCSIGSNPKK